MTYTRRDFARISGASLAAAAAGSLLPSLACAAEPLKPTEFQIACMTLPYSQFPLARALEGIKGAGYDYVAWGTSHKESGGDKSVPVMAADAPVERAKELGQKCRDMGLAPLMMFSGIYPENPKGLEVHTQRLKQAAAAGIPQVLTFGHTGKAENSNEFEALWVERLKLLGPIARDLGVLLVVKQHGGTTGSGEACAKIVRQVNDAGVMVNYDAGNVMDYLDLDPIPDIKKCADTVRSFCIKDHRNFPKDEDVGPGLGEIDHYKLLHPVAWTGLKMPLCCENISAPIVARPNDPKDVDALSRRAREFLETVTSGLKTWGK